MLKMRVSKPFYEGECYVLSHIHIYVYSIYGGGRRICEMCCKFPAVHPLLLGGSAMQYRPGMFGQVAVIHSELFLAQGRVVRLLNSR